MSFDMQVPFKSDSVTSFGDSGVERDIHITPPLTPPNSICNSRATEKQKYRLSVISDSGVDMMKQYSDERMPPVTESQSFLRFVNCVPVCLIPIASMSVIYINNLAVVTVFQV
jgi:hypothetical protein